jgi:hypothetical protein
VPPVGRPHLAAPRFRRPANDNRAPLKQRFRQGLAFAMVAALIGGIVLLSG